MSPDPSRSGTPPPKPTVVTHVGGLFGFVLLIIGSIAVVGNLIAMMIGAAHPGTGAMAENIRATDTVAAGIACSVSFVILWLPGLYLFIRARKRIKEYAAYSGAPGRSPAGQIVLWGLLLALLGFISLIIMYFSR